MAEPEIRELEITALAHGGEGLGRDGEGRVTFVARTAPGDRVRVRLTQVTKGFARGELVTLLAPGATRREVACTSYHQGCGGCPWLGVDEVTQRTAKAGHVAQALRQVLGEATVHPLVTASPSEGWRRRTRVHVRGGKLGFMVEASHAVVDALGCTQLAPALVGALRAIAKAQPPDGEYYVTLGAGNRLGVVAQLVARQATWPEAPGVLGKAGIIGVTVNGQVHGEPMLEVDPGVHIHADGFAQASKLGNQALVACVQAALPPAQPGQRLLELYAGAGNLTTAALAQGYDVVASDVVAPPAWSLSATFRVGAANVVTRPFSKGAFAAVLLDPPRAGAKEVTADLLRLAPATIVYVSCDVATLARDVARLAEGYRLVDVWPHDIMPQTPHVEVVARLQRR